MKIVLAKLITVITFSFTTLYSFSNQISTKEVPILDVILDDQSTDDNSFLRLPIILSDIDALTFLQQSCCVATNSNIDEIFFLDQSCCAQTNSSISALSSFDQSALGSITSRISALSALDQSCCSQTNSGIGSVASAVSALAVFDQNCCAQTNNNISILSLINQGCCTSTNSSISALSSFDQSALGSVTSRISALSAFDQSCCAQTNSNISVLSSFDQSALGSITSRISALSALDQSCCSQTNSGIGSVASAVSVLSVFDQNCCGNTTALLSEIINQLNELNNCSCCQTMITNKDIAGGNSYIIKDPGIYCLAEDIEFTSGGFAIYIQDTRTQVILDLNQHTITGTGGGTAINVSGNQGGVTIKNGAFLGADIGIQTESCKNTIIENIFFYNQRSIGFLDKQSAGLKIENIEVSDSLNGLFFIGTEDVFLKNIEIRFVEDNGININAVKNGTLDSVNVFTTNGAGFYITSSDGITSNITFNYCKTDVNAGAGFIVQAINGFAVDSIIFSNCISTNSKIVGFGISSDPSNINEISNILYDSCIGENNGFGFYIVINSPNAANNLLFKNCVTQSCQRSGYLLTGGGDVKSVVFQDCVALETEGYGFYIDTGIGCLFNSCTAILGTEGIYLDGGLYSEVLNCITAENKRNGIVINSDFCLVQACKSTHNANDGIMIMGGKNNQVLNCYASNNEKIGIEDVSGGNYIHGNNATLNSAGNFVPNGLGIPIDNTSPYWANVRDPLVP